MTERAGIVVPTIGTRPDFLPLALKSIRQAGANAYILLVGNQSFDPSSLIAEGLIDEYLVEPEPGLAAKINFGLRALPSDIRFFNWLGDDDLLTPGSLAACLERMAMPDNPVLVFGKCDYIDPKGAKVWQMPTSRWSVRLLRFGPQLIPQPGSLYSRAAFERVGGLDTSLGWAFDFKLFLDLSKQGNCVFLPRVLAQFRWHPDSLSVRGRRNSVAEASLVRQNNLPVGLRAISALWEYPVRQATYWAGVRLSRKLAVRPSGSGS